MTATVADKLDQIAAEFAELEPRERLELLLELSLIHISEPTRPY